LSIKSEILKSYSRQNTVRVAESIGHDKSLFNELMTIYFDGKHDMDLARKAAWVLRYCSDYNPHLIDPYIKKLVKYIGKKGHHDAIKRNGLAVLQETSIPEKLYGPIANTCFKFLQSSKEPIAIKAYSMSILDKIGDDIPEIRHELKLIIQELMPYESAGFKSRARKILSK
jgi:hypothetical protein